MDGLSTPLSHTEHRFLWRLAHGMTSQEAGADLQLPTWDSARNTAHRIRSRLDARTNAHAVYVAMSIPLLGPHEECGWLRGRRTHLKLQEEICRACRAEQARALQRSGRPAPAVLTLTPPERALVQQLAGDRPAMSVRTPHCRSQSELLRQLPALYLKFNVDHYPPTMRREALLEEVHLRGLFTLNKPPAYRPPGPRCPDGIVWLTPKERAALEAVADGSSLSVACVRLGLKRDALASKLSLIYNKMGLRSLPRDEKRAAALKAARDLGYIP
jgi:DNA-binding CsgD family transcriptional regulator